LKYVIWAGQLKLAAPDIVRLTFKAFVGNGFENGIVPVDALGLYSPHLTIRPDGSIV
jgi:hypothetical protein